MNIQDIGNDISVLLVRKPKSVSKLEICAVLTVCRHLRQILCSAPGHNANLKEKDFLKKNICYAQFVYAMECLFIREDCKN